ncbi:hypothetical protein EXIGLDRAFT_766913 [Exidia glandulosa HHB12029]|uniref:Uncharacterized protein n=1 Tax=Exidia glandulosa HHB12029 TaxID=1314781 RepID=A0A165JBY1_EXIGL|nr:hypothetical protein EXIGLDRAFT_766913 [Exidia glandulosa HHB12029]
MVLAFVLSAATYGLYGFTTLSPVFWGSTEWSVEDKGPLRAKPSHNCGSAFCEAMTYLITILARHDFRRSAFHKQSEVEKRLKARTFDTFALFCREFRLAPCTHLESNLTFWMSGDNPFSQISLCSRDITSFLHYFKWVDRDARVRMIRHLLHPDQSWCAPDSPDRGRGDALDACLDNLVNPYRPYLSLPAVRILLDDACLEPLQRAPHWNDSPLLLRCAEALAWEGDDGSDLEDLVSKFIFCEAKGGPDGTSTRTWDLVVAGSQMILADAQNKYNQVIHKLCQTFGSLRRRYPYKARWKEMGDRVREGAASFLNDAAWRARTGENKSVKIQKRLEKFWEVMSSDDSGLEMNTELLWATDELQSVGATSQNFIEWQVDGAY